MEGSRDAGLIAAVGELVAVRRGDHDRLDALGRHHRGCLSEDRFRCRGNHTGDSGSKTEVYALGDPPPRGDSRKIEDDGSAAQQIVDFLAEKRLL